MSPRLLTCSLPFAQTLILLCVGCDAGPDSALAGPPATVQSIVDRLSREQYQKYHLDVESMGLGLYGGEHYDMGHRNRDYRKGEGGTPGNMEASLYLQDAFKSMGLYVTVQGIYQNVVAELKGTKTPENIYILGGHFDHIEGDSPGGDDNASGTAGVLEAARIMSQYKFESTIRFIAFNAEEDGLRGSKDYVEQVVGAENILGMLNMDMILRPGSDAKPDMVIDVEIETNGSMPWVEAYVKAAKDYVPALVIGDLWDGRDSSSDNDSFQAVGIPSLLVIENSWGDFYAPNPVANSYYHHTEDASDRLANDPDGPSGVTYDYGFALDVTRAAVGLLAQQAVLCP